VKLTLSRKNAKGPPVRSNIRTSHNTLGQRDQPLYDVSNFPGNPQPEEASGYLATSSTMQASVLRAGLRTANLAEERAGTPVDGTADRVQGSVGGRPKAAKKQPRPIPSQKAWQEYQALRTVDTPDNRGPAGVRIDVSAGGERGLIDYEGAPRAGMPDQSGFDVPATPSGRIPWLTKDYIRDNASLYEWGWPAFNTYAVVIHPQRYLATRYRGQYPARGLKSVSGVMAQQGSGEASKIHIPAIFIPQP
jgi:hypothetical protein